MPKKAFFGKSESERLRPPRPPPLPAFFLPPFLLSTSPLDALLVGNFSHAGIHPPRHFLSHDEDHKTREAIPKSYRPSATRSFVESGFFPGVVFYLSLWYKRNEQLYRATVIISTASLGGAFGGLFASGFHTITPDSPHSGEGECLERCERPIEVWMVGGGSSLSILMTIVAAAAAYFFIHNYPMTARFLTPEEQELALARVRKDSDTARDKEFTWTGVCQALKDPKIYFYGFCYHTTILSVYTLTSFLPTIITGLGFLLV